MARLTDLAVLARYKQALPDLEAIMSSKRSRESKPRPFPWACSDCCTLTVVPTVMDYTAKVKHDGVVYELQLHSVEISRCQTCGETYSTTVVDDQVSEALRTRLRFLAPEQIRKGIKRLGLNQRQVAAELGVAEETVSRWLNGALIQSRAMDNFMRVYFGCPAARETLRGVSQDPRVGTADEFFDAELAAGNENLLPTQ